jgi:hypothetical protein
MSIIHLKNDKQNTDQERGNMNPLVVEQHQEALKGGPRTPEGKAIVRTNAIKHGLLSNIIPEDEETAYRAHVTAIHAHYAPVGYLEEALTERIATALWRLGRVARYESVLVKQSTDRGIAQLHQDPDPRTSFPWQRALAYPDDLQREIEAVTRALELHQLGPVELANRDSQTLEQWVRGALSYGAKHRAEDEHVAASRKVDQMHGIKQDEDDDWAAQSDEGRVLAWDFTKAKKAFELLISSKSQKLKLSRDWETCRQWLVWHLQVMEIELKSTTQKRVEIYASHAVPMAETTAKIAKYEAHIERTLYRAMHELEAMQERRAGKATPLARVQLHGED